MKSLTQRIYSHPGYARILQWGKLISFTGSAQLLVQAIGFISGIMIIRTLSMQEYALYTLANTMLGAMVVLGDGGISSGVMAEGGNVWQDQKKLGMVVTTGINLKKKFALGCFLVAIPVLFLLFHQHGSNWLMSGLVIVSLIPAFYTALSNQLLEIAPRLRQDIFPLQKIQLGANVGRLVLLGLCLFAFPWAFIALLAYGVPQIWANRKMREKSNAYVDYDQKPDPAARKKIMAIVKRKLPEAIYYCISGQITIWLLSIFGSTAAIAQIGGLGRLAVMINLIFVLFSILILPRFARLPKDSGLLLVRFFQILAGLFVLSIFLFGAFWLFSSEVLWILGPGYLGLRNELLLNTVAACLGLIAGASFYLCTGRGWILNPFLSIPISISAIVCGAIIFDISSLQGILMLNIFVAAVQLLLYGGYGFFKIMKKQ